MVKYEVQSDMIKNQTNAVKSRITDSAYRSFPYDLDLKAKAEEKNNHRA